MFRQRLISVCVGAVLAGLAPVASAALDYNVTADSYAKANTVEHNAAPLTNAGYAYSSSYATDTAHYASGIGDGTPGGVFRVGADGGGTYVANGVVSFSRTLTNTLGVPALYSYDFLIEQGSLSVGREYADGGYLPFDPETGVSAAYEIVIKWNGNTVWSSSAEVSLFETGPATLTRTGKELSTGEILGLDSGWYAWNPYLGHLDLGVLDPGANGTLEYLMRADVDGNVGLYSYVDGGGYGYGCYGPTSTGSTIGPMSTTIGCDTVRGWSTARFGDPGDFYEDPYPNTGGVTFEPLETPVPVPGTLLLLGAGLGALGIARKRRLH